MSKWTLGVVALMVLAVPAALMADPPGRPVPLTPKQFKSLQKMEQRPEHAAVLGVQATYTSDRKKRMDFEKASDDFWTVAYSGGWPATILGLVICAAPF